MNSIFLTIFLLFLLYKYNSLQITSTVSSKNDYIDSTGDLYKNEFNTNIYLPEYQNKFSRINELNDSNFDFNNIKNNKSVVLIPDNIIAKNEKLLEIEEVAKLINKIENNDNNNTSNKKITKNKKEIYPEDYSFYGNKNNLNGDHNYKFIKKNAIIYDKATSSIKDIISTEPEEIKIDYEICKPKTILFKIFNKNADENLIIRSIKTDLYQVKIFPYISNKNNNNDIIPENLTPNIDSYLEHSIYPRTIFVFQLLFLLDYKTKIKGNLYIEFNDKKVLLIPIEIFGFRNIHSIEPIYRFHFQTHKIFEEHIKIANPTSKTVHIKEIIHSFEKIKVYWENGELFNNNSYINSSMLEVESISEKRILTLKYYAKNIESEYGFIHIRTEENIFIIPILLNTVNSPIIPEPKLINFGLCDITPKSRYNIIRLIPFKLKNEGKEYIKIGKVYINYDEIFLQFHQNFAGNNIVIKPNEEVNFGYFIFNANLEPNKNPKNIKDISNTQKKIYIETNSTKTPFIEILYSYIPYMNNELQEISGNIQKKPKNSELLSFHLNVKFKKGIKLRTYNTYLPGEYITLRERDMVIKIINPKNEQQATNSKIYIEMDKMSELKSFHYFFIPLLLNNMLYTIIPIQIDNQDLTKVYCGDEETSKTLAICIKNIKPGYIINAQKKTNNKQSRFNIDFGNVAQGIIKKRYIYLLNSNDSPIEVKNIVINNTHIFSYVDIEGYEYFGNEEEPHHINYPKKGKLLNQLKDRYFKDYDNRTISFTVYPYTAVKISIIIFTEKININKIIKNEIIFYYGENYKLIFSLNASVFLGGLQILDKAYNFEPSFPGLYQRKLIHYNNNYNCSMNIISVNSNDKRIIYKLLTDKIHRLDKDFLMTILFDPSKYFEYKKDYEINMSNILTYKELYLWKIEDKYFDKMERLGLNTINANVSIKTSISMEYINFNGLIIKPNLVKKEKINFGVNQIGKPAEIFIEGINPSDKILLIKLLLADESYSDINNNNMFNLKDKILLEQNNDLVIFTCNFLIKINSTNIIKYEYILVPEKIDLVELREGSFNKKELIRLLYKYGNEKVKHYLFKADNILCKYDKKKQNEILFNKNNENNHYISQVFSKDFNNEIISVKNMTNKNIEENPQNKPVEKKSFFHSLVSYLFNLYLKYFMNVALYSNINIIENTQSFFIPKNIQNKIYQIPPHKTFSIGPIIFKPNKSGTIRGTLFLKNNLTLLYPLKLEGEGGGGIIRFFDYYRGINKKKCKIYNEKNLVIEIDEEIYNNEIKNNKDKFNRTITLMNVGNLPLVIKNVTIDNAKECKSNNLKIFQCKEISLSPKEMIDIDLEISPNYRNSVTNKIIYFNTEYQSFYLNAIIILSNEFYEKKNFVWIYIKCFIVVFTIISVMMYSINRILLLVQKQRKEMCDNEENKEDILNEKGDKEMLIKEEKEEINLNNNNKKVNINLYGNKQIKGNKKKKRKRSIQKEEIETNNNNKLENIKKDNTENTDNKKEIINEINIEEKGKENKNKENNNNLEKDDKKINKEDKEDKKEDIKEKTKEDNNINQNVIKNKKRRIKSSVSSKKNDDEKNNSKIKRDNKEESESISEDKKEKEKKKSIESNKYNNENETYESYNYNYNKKYPIKYKKGKKDLNRKYYYPNYTGTRKYNNNNNYYNYYENNNVSNNNYNNNYINNNYNYNNYYSNNNYNNSYNNHYNNNYNNNNFDNNNYNNNYQQPKKNITKITVGEKNVRNLKELFESEQNNSKNKNKSNKKSERNNNTEDKNINKIINNINNTNKSNNDNNKNDFSIFDDNLFGNKKQDDLFGKDFPINKKVNLGEKKEEMNPTFLTDERINNEFNFEQDLIKSLKKENKNIKENIQKDDSDIDFNDSDNFNFNYFFFDKNQSQEEEGEYTGNYDDYKYKSLIDNLNSEYPLSTDEPKGNMNDNSNNVYNEDKKEESENDEDDEYWKNKNKFGINFINFDKNY